MPVVMYAISAPLTNRCSRRSKSSASPGGLSPHEAAGMVEAGLWPSVHATSSACRTARAGEQLLSPDRAHPSDPESISACLRADMLTKSWCIREGCYFLSWLNSSTSCAYRSFPAGAASCCSSSSEAAHTAAATLSLLTWRPTCPLNFDFHRQAVMSKRIQTSLCIQCCSRSVTCCSTIFLVNMTTRATVSIAYPDHM